MAKVTFYAALEHLELRSVDKLEDKLLILTLQEGNRLLPARVIRPGLQRRNGKNKGFLIDSEQSPNRLKLFGIMNNDLHGFFFLFRFIQHLGFFKLLHLGIFLQIEAFDFLHLDTNLEGFELDGLA